MPAAKGKVILHHSRIELQVLEHYDAVQKEELLYRFYRQELRMNLARLVPEYAGRLGLAAPEFGI